MIQVSLTSESDILRLGAKFLLIFEENKKQAIHDSLFFFMTCVIRLFIFIFIICDL